MSNLPTIPGVNDKQLARVMSAALPKYFTLNELRAILSDHLRQQDYKTWFLCFMLSRTGARISELLDVTLKDIDPQNKTVRLRTLKQSGTPERVVPIQGDVISEIAQWVLSQGLSPGDKLFNFGRKMAAIRVKNACKLANVGVSGDDDRAHAHTFRHTFAVINLGQGVPVTVLREWLGHSSILSTLVYSRILAQHSRHFADQIQW